MIRDKFDHGFDPLKWESAKTQARSILYLRAKRERLIAYSDLVEQITDVSMDAYDTRYFHFLGEISSEDDSNGKGLTTAIVVHKGHDTKPGPGFFNLAESHGRDTSDIEQCWVTEVRAVFDYWKA